MRKYAPFSVELSFTRIFYLTFLAHQKEVSAVLTHFREFYGKTIKALRVLVERFPTIH